MLNSKEYKTFHDELESIMRSLYDELIKLSDRNYFIESDLTGACLVGSCVLFERLHRLGMRPELVYGYETNFRTEHFWVMCNYWTLDPTYSQYDSRSDFLAIPDTNHPVSFDSIKIDAKVPDWGWGEHPKTYWKYFNLGNWRRSAVKRAGRICVMR